MNNNVNENKTGTDSVTTMEEHLQPLLDDRSFHEYSHRGLAWMLMWLGCKWGLFKILPSYFFISAKRTEGLSIWQKSFNYVAIEQWQDPLFNIIFTPCFCACRCELKLPCSYLHVFVAFNIFFTPCFCACRFKLNPSCSYLKRRMDDSYKLSGKSFDKDSKGQAH